MHYRYLIAALILGVGGFGVGSHAAEAKEAPNVVPEGKWVKVTEPGTLDLVERAELSINALTGNVDPKEFYGVYQGFTYTKSPPVMHSKTWNITPKNARTLPQLRYITGTDKNADIEWGMMQALVDHIDDNGLLYYPFDGSGPPKGTSYPQINALTMFAMLNFYARDKDPNWLALIDKLAKGLRAAAIQVEDRAYYPMQSGIDRNGKWHFMHHEGEIPIPYTPPDEPKSDQEGLEGAAKSDQIRCMSALAKHYRLTGDKESLAMALKISRFVMKPEMWDDTKESGFAGYEHGVWSGHFHNGTQALMGILDLAEATDNDHLRQFVREGYNRALVNGVVRVGWFPAWSMPTKFNRPANLMDVTEPCALADAVCLAVMMSDAGLGDYWDDVDSIIRNILLSQQVTNIDLFSRAGNNPPGSEGYPYLQRFLGGFVNGTLTHLWPEMPGCCTANGGQGIFYAWEGITRFNKGVATVNLFLNRVSPWMDVMSYLPYEGKVELRNKQAHTALVRIPRWLSRDGLKSTINGVAADPALVNNQLMFSGLKPGDLIELTFEVPESNETYIINNRMYGFRFRGSTVVHVDPPAEDRPSGTEYPILPDERLSGAKAPMRTVNRFVANELPPLGTF